MFFSYSKAISANFILQEIAMTDIFFQNNIGDGEAVLGVEPTTDKFEITATREQIDIKSENPMYCVELYTLAGTRLHRSPEDINAIEYIIKGKFSPGVYVVAILCNNGDTLYSTRVIIK